jgi:hypothetical protein
VSGHRYRRLRPELRGGRRAKITYGVWVVQFGGALGAGSSGAGGCAWRRWPDAGPLIVSSTRFLCARPRRGRSPASSARKPCSLPTRRTEGTVSGGRRTRPGGGLPPPVPSQTHGSLRAVVECAGTCITRRQPPQVSLQLDTMLTEYSLRPACDTCRHHTQAFMVGL